MIFSLRGKKNLDQFFHDQKTAECNSLTPSWFIYKVGILASSSVQFEKVVEISFVNHSCLCTELNVFVSFQLGIFQFAVFKTWYFHQCKTTSMRFLALIVSGQHFRGVCKTKQPSPTPSSHICVSSFHISISSSPPSHIHKWPISNIL